MKKDKLIESFFFKEENVLSESLIQEFIKKEFFKLKEQKEEAISKDIAFRSIPDIDVDELYWADMASDKQMPLTDEETWLHEHRSMLMKFTENISGATLEQKIKNIENFYSIKSIEDLQKFGFDKSSSNGQYVNFLISYLVFIKTITKILSQINSQAAGNVFESFLAVLLKGKQLADRSRIIDIEAEESGNPLYISCKLLSKTNTSAPGSIKNLQKDLQDGKTVYYVIAVKDFDSRDKVLSKEGVIRFYKVGLNLENLYNFFAKAGNPSTKEFLRLPKEYIASDGVDQYTIKKIPSSAIFFKQSKADDQLKKVAEQEDPSANDPSDEIESKDSFKDFSTFEESLKFFNELSLENKNKALKNTYGYLAVKQFTILKNQIPKEQLINFANITIGRTAIAEMVNTFKNEVFKNTLSVVSNLSAATDLFNQYISTGLEDNAKAQKSKNYINDSEKRIESIMGRKRR